MKELSLRARAKVPFFHRGIKFVLHGSIQPAPGQLFSLQGCPTGFQSAGCGQSVQLTSQQSLDPEAPLTQGKLTSQGRTLKHMEVFCGV